MTKKNRVNHRGNQDKNPLNNDKEEIDLFYKAVKGVKSLPASGKISRKQQQTENTLSASASRSGSTSNSNAKLKHRSHLQHIARKKKLNAFEEEEEERHNETQHELYLTDHTTQEVTREERLTFISNGVSPRYFKKLKMGNVPIEAKLDLHGKTIDEARKALVRFLYSAQSRELRCIQIIHGKGNRVGEGEALLKNRVNTWLKQLPQILAFSSSMPRDGGTGALYVLLKKT